MHHLTILTAVLTLSALGCRTTRPADPPRAEEPMHRVAVQEHRYLKVALYLPRRPVAPGQTIPARFHIETLRPSPPGASDSARIPPTPLFIERTLMSGHDNLTVRVAGALNDPMTHIVHDGIVSIGDAEHPDPIECQHFCCGQDYGGDYPPRFTITAPLLMRDDWQTANTKVTLLLSVNQLHDADMNSHLGSTFDFPFVLHNSNFVQASDARAEASNTQ